MCAPLVTAGDAGDQPTDNASAYQLIRSVVIPVHRDERTREQRILDDVRQQINRLSSKHPELYYCYERSVLAIPLQTAFECIWRNRDFDVDELRYTEQLVANSVFATLVLSLIKCVELALIVLLYDDD